MLVAYKYMFIGCIYLAINSMVIYLATRDNLPIRIMRYDLDEIEEHPGCFDKFFQNDNRLEEIENQTCAWQEFYFPNRSHLINPQMFFVADEKILNETIQQKGLQTLFNPRAYLSTDMKSLQIVAEKEFSRVIEECRNNTAEWAFEKSKQSGIPLCSCDSPDLKGRIDLTLDPPSLEDIASELGEIQPGGHWTPSHCTPRQRVALIIPYRDRASHLHIFLNHYHRMLQRQGIEYRIFVSEQASPNIFNKGSVMNIGFILAKEHFDFDCVIFHDIDLLAEDDRHLYLCSDQPRHITARNDRSNYTKPYYTLVGGAVALPTHVFEHVNGYTNAFYGWGGEDDVLGRRIAGRGYRIVRFPPSLSRFVMLTHRRKGKSFPRNHMVQKQMLLDKRQKASEGLNSVKYILHGKKMLPLYTWFLVELDNELTGFWESEGWCGQKYLRKGRLYTLNRCASACKDRRDCQSFSYFYVQQGVCFLYGFSCQPEPHKNYPAYTFTKNSLLVRDGSYL